MAVRIPLITDFDGRGIKKAMAEFKQLEGSAAKTKFALQKAFLPAAAALGGLAAAGLKAVKAGERAATANARIEQVATSMGLYGDEVKTVTDRLVTLANKTALATGVDQNSIKLTQAKLLTFKELAKTANTVGGSFDRATKAAVDLAAAGFGEASTNAVQLGKALQDPIKGITALARSGVTFTAQEKEKIRVLTESGRILEAQELILSAIETQVGGTAEATANATDKIKVGFSQVSEAIGLALLPVFEQLSKALLGFSNWAKNNTAVFIGLATVVGVFATAVIAANVGIKAYNALTITTTALNKLLGSSFTRLQTAMGGVGLALTAAAGIYAIVTNRKKDTTQATKDLAAALKLEKGAQEESIQELIRRDSNTRKAITALDKMGLSLDDLTEFVEQNTGALAVTNEQMRRMTSTAGVTEGELFSLLTTVKSLSGEFKDAAEAADLYNRVTVNIPKMDLDKYFARQGIEIGKTAEETTKLASTTETAMDRIRQAFSDARAGARTALKGLRDQIASTISGAITADVNFGAIKQAAVDAGTTFMASLSATVDRARNFAARLQQLMAAGLSPSAISQVAQAGAEAGTAIADELLAGGATAIAQANDLVAAAEHAAKQTGALAGATYYNEGTVLAQQLTKGITDVISKYKIKLRSPGLTEKQLNRLRNRFALDVDFVMSQVPALAAGGIVASPTLALIGEAGPEAVVPLDKMGQMGNVTINVNGGDPNAVVDALRRYMVTNGPVPITVQ